MFIYRDTLSNFNSLVDQGIIADTIAKNMKDKHIGTGASQYRAFDRSLEKLSNVLSSEYFDQNLECAIEYRINSCGGCRVDFMLSGYDDSNNKNIVLFELKQWSYENIKLIDDSDNVEALVALNRIEEKDHPSSQALGYANMFKLYYDIISKDVCHIYPCSYMHEYIEREPRKMTDDRFADILKDSPAFFKRDNDRLRSFIKRYIKTPDAGVIFEQLENSEIVPSKQLKENIDSLILNNSKIQLIDEQQVAFNAIYSAVRKAIINTNKKTTFIIKGGPGTGKSIIALKLVGKVTKELNAPAFYTSYNSPPRYTFIDALNKASKNDPSKKGTSTLIRWAGNWVRDVSVENELTLVVADEAHRLQTSTQGAIKGLTMIGEIIKSAKVSVFFLDEKQFVHASDKGTADNIRKEAAKFNSQLIEKDEYNLKTQFRCGGSDGYIAFLRKLIYNENVIDPVWLKDFKFKVFNNETPKEMMDELRILNNQGIKSRVVAGYCYEWDKVNDVTIKDFKKLWNLNTKDWGYRDDSFEEIGCVFSSQGIEFDYVGVIIGNDMKYENGQIVYHPENHAKSDHSSKIYSIGIKNKEEAIRLIKNHYFVLLTRGAKGCYIYCQDKALAEYIEKEFEKSQDLLMD